MKKTNEVPVENQATPFDDTQETALVVLDDTGDTMLASLTTRTAMYCSVTAETDEQKMALFNAINNPSKRLGDCIGETISINGMFAETVRLTNEDTGEVNDAPRIVFFSPDGESYQCVSLTIFNTMKKLFGLFGNPGLWSKPRSVKVKQISKGTKRMLTLEMV